MKLQEMASPCLWGIRERCGEVLADAESNDELRMQAVKLLCELQQELDTRVNPFRANYDRQRDKLSRKDFR